MCHNNKDSQPWVSSHRYYAANLSKAANQNYSQAAIQFWLTPIYTITSLAA